MKILLVSNCNTEGLRNSFYYFAPQLDLDAFDIDTVKKHYESIDFNKYDIIIGITDFLNILKKSISALQIKLEPFSFSAFHPDICYLKHKDGHLISSKLSHYHSLVIITAFMADLNLKQTINLFNLSMFNQLGYLDLWDNSVKNLKLRYDFLNINIDEWLQKRIGTQNAFMHSINHPNIYMLSDLTQYLLNYLGIKYEPCDNPPIPDNLALGPAWPVYNEIADYYGFSGSYRFKYTFKTMDLERYINQCFDLYRQLGKENITILHSQIPSESAKKIITL